VRKRMTILSSLAAMVVALAALTGCGGSSDASSDTTATAAGTTAAPATDWSYRAEFVDCTAAATDKKGCVGEKIAGTYNALPKADITKQWNICASLPHLKDAYWLAVNYGLVEEAKRAGATLQVFEAGGYTNLSKQISQLDNCVSQGANAVVIGGISYDGLNAKVDEFVGKDIPVIDILNGISSEKVSGHALVNFYDMGFQVGKYLAGLDKAVKVAWFPGPPGAGWVESANTGFKDAIKGSKVEVLATKYGDTGKEVQLALIENALQTYDQIDYIAGTAVTAEAAVSALQERNLTDKVKILADYMIPSTHKLIEDGQIACAPTDQPVVQARMGIDMAVRLLEGKELDEGYGRVGPQVQLVCGPSAGDKNNLGTFDYEATFAAKGFKPTFNVG
jgi:protein TorT